MGLLRVDVISAKGLVGADRSGKSDVSVPVRNDFMLLTGSAVRRLHHEWPESTQDGDEEKVRRDLSKSPIDTQNPFSNLGRKL